MLFAVFGYFSAAMAIENRKQRMTRLKIKRAKVGIFVGPAPALHTASAKSSLPHAYVIVVVWYELLTCELAPSEECLLLLGVLK